jgi:hypothetical protein
MGITIFSAVLRRSVEIVKKMLLLRILIHIFWSYFRAIYVAIAINGDAFLRWEEGGRNGTIPYVIVYTSKLS